MATYGSLSQEDKDILGAFERNARGWINGIISTGIVQARALKAAHDASGGAADILASLDAGEVVPNSGAIAGAQDLTKEEWAVLLGAMAAFLTDYDTNNVRQYAAKAAGPTAGI